MLSANENTKLKWLCEEVDEDERKGNDWIRIRIETHLDWLWLATMTYNSIEEEGYIWLSVYKETPSEAEKLEIIKPS